MKHNREFEIAWQGLKLGRNSYRYDIDDRFMQEWGGSPDCKDWDAHVTLGFDKHENFFMLHFDIDGKVSVPCDRCGDDYELRLWDEFNLIIKLIGGDDSEKPDDEDDVVFIPRSETVINIGKWLYEFLMLSVPLQHIHPDKADGASGCNQAALDLLGSMSDASGEQTNPLWKGLEAFKNVDEGETKPRKSKKK